MMVFKAVLDSLKIKSLKIAVYIWLFSFFLSFLVYYCFYHLFSVSFGHTVFLKNFSFQTIWPHLIEIFHNNKSLSVIFLSAILLLLVLFVLISIFLSGAIFSIFINGEEKTFKNLLLSSIENFTKMLKVFFINMFNWIFVILISGTGLYLLWSFQKNSGNEPLVGILIYLWALVFIFLLIFSLAIYDFSRIIRIKTDRNFLYSFQEGIKFVFTNKTVILLLFIIYAVSTIIFHVLMLILLNKVEKLLHVLFLLVLYQTFIILKYYMKTILMNAEVNIYLSSLNKFENPN